MQTLHLDVMIVKPGESNSPPRPIRRRVIFGDDHAPPLTAASAPYVIAELRQRSITKLADEPRGRNARGMAASKAKNPERALAFAGVVQRVDQRDAIGVDRATHRGHPSPQPAAPSLPPFPVCSTLVLHPEAVKDDEQARE